ncbi:hypothetical protein AGMMS49975_05710 [Clostridia bacterium]|nr:hypothetical protein AGMMS49975_05710 [Clostridia bacterium]
MTDYQYKSMVYMAYDKAKSIAQEKLSPDEAEKFLGEWQEWYANMTGLTAGERTTKS